MVAEVTASNLVGVSQTSTLRSTHIVGIMLVVVLTGCMSSDSSKEPKRPDPPERASGQQNPRRSVEAAVEALLSAEQRGDYAGSYALLSRAGRRDYPTVARWMRRRTRLPAVTDFTVAATSDDTAVATVSHEPALDPFRGLTPGRERQTWNGRKTGAGWLLDSDPTVKLVLPSDAAAKEAASQWAGAVQRCDQTGARAFQAVDQLFGDANAASGLCGSVATVVADGVSRLGAGPSSADIVAQYSTDALNWAKVVEVKAPVAFGAVVVPLGDIWRIIGILPPSGSSNP